MNEKAEKKASLTGKGKKEFLLSGKTEALMKVTSSMENFMDKGSTYGPMVINFPESGKTVKRMVMGVSQDLMDLFLSASSVMMFPMERVFTLDRMEQLFQEIGKMVSKTDTVF